MIVATEFNFKRVFGPLKEVIARVPEGAPVLIADPGTWGHIPFHKEAIAMGRKPVLGARAQVVANEAGLTDKKALGPTVFLAPRDAGELRGLYELVSISSMQNNKLTRSQFAEHWTGGLAFATAPLPGTETIFMPGINSPGPGMRLAASDNLYPRAQDHAAWELLTGRAGRRRAGPGHILTAPELKLAGALPSWPERLSGLLRECETPLPQAQNIRFPVPDAQAALEAFCWEALMARGLGSNATYRERLAYELRLIADKKFADYFLVISDMIRWAKERMLVGPARGSSAGSLVCWLTRITEIDPLPHGLIFERFIDVNRADLPDIDIDFPDEQRHLVLTYLQGKYGAANVAHIGTVIRYQAKSALTECAKALNVPLWELNAVKDVLIERSSGDARAGNCLEDSLNELAVGRALIEKYPTLKLASRLEDHARTAGVHAAGWIICNSPVSHYCSIGGDVTAQLDKYAAEKINILKIDALGLRTLSILEDACQQVGMPPQALYDLPLDDQKAFDLVNAHKYCGIFQFEGLALQSVANRCKVDRFSDFSAITALCRPGPMTGGETQHWLDRKAGREPVTYPHPLMEPYLKDTLGCVMYQEVVMRTTREIGGFSWSDTSAIRKLMSKSEGDEKFAKFEKKFMEGAIERGVDENAARQIWKSIHSFGSWAFNQSHSVAYGLVSYWCAYLKARHPLEFAVANLRRARDEDSALALLREILREEGAGQYIPFDFEKSEANWAVKEGKLYGGMLQLRGCGEKTAKEISIRRKAGLPLTKRQETLLRTAKSEFLDPFPAETLWGDHYAHPERHFRSVRKLSRIGELDDKDPNARVVILGQLMKKDLRSLNETKYLAKRGGKRVPDADANMLQLYLADDTGRMLCIIRPHLYAALGKRIVEEALLGSWFAVAGRVPRDIKMLRVEAIQWLQTSTTTLTPQPAP